MPEYSDRISIDDWDLEYKRAGIEDLPVFGHWERALADFKEALRNYEGRRTAAAWTDLRKAINELNWLTDEIG